MGAMFSLVKGKAADSRSPITTREGAKTLAPQEAADAEREAWATTWLRHKGRAGTPWRSTQGGRIQNQSLRLPPLGAEDVRRAALSF